MGKRKIKLKNDGGMKMSKKRLMIIMLVAILAFTLGMGTIAYYTKTFTSSDNIVRAARFEVDSNGTLDEDVEFDLSGDPVYPGIEKDIYEFEINKKKTEVPVEYKIKLTPSEDLFESIEGKASPVDLYLYRQVGQGWKKVGGVEEVVVTPNQNLEKFKIGLEWKHSDEIDILYQGKTGKIAIQVIATQTDGDIDPPETAELIATFREEELLKNFGWVSIDVKNVDGADKFDVTYVLADGNVITTEMVNIGEEAGLIFYNRGNPVDIQIYGTGGNLLHTFNDITLLEGEEPELEPTIKSLRYKEEISPVPGKGLTGYLFVEYDNIPEDAYYQRFIYTTIDGKVRNGSYGKIQAGTGYDIDPKGNILDGKIGIEITNRERTEVLHLFSDVSIPESIK